MSQIRDKLHKIQVNSISQDEINKTAGPIFFSDKINLMNAETIARFAHSIRTFGAFPDPGGGSIASAGNATTLTVQPDEGNQYLIQSISVVNNSGGDGLVTVNLTDGSTAASLVAQAAPDGASTPINLPYPVYITNTAYVVISSSATMTTIATAYQNTVRGS